VNFRLLNKKAVISHMRNSSFGCLRSLLLTRASELIPDNVADYPALYQSARPWIIGGAILPGLMVDGNEPPSGNLKIFFQ